MMVYCIFFHDYLSPYTLFHLHPLLTPAITMLLSVFMSSLFIFLFVHPSIPSTPPRAVICSPSMSLSLFSVLVQFAHWIPHISEIIWYLSFSDWLITLNIIPSSSIRAVANGKTFFFFYGPVVFHCVNLPCQG